MPGRKERGFTLLEIVLAIAVMALIAATVIGISARLVARRAAGADDLFWKASAEARKMALESGKETQLSFDDKTKAFVIGNGRGAKTIPVPAADDLAVSFITSQGGTSSVLIGGALVDTNSIKYVTFYPDGTCTPFRIQIRQRGSVHSQGIDPWTCARVLSGGDGATAANF